MKDEVFYKLTPISSYETIEYLQTSISVFKSLKLAYDLAVESSVYVLNDKMVQELIHRKGSNFSLIINLEVNHDVFLIFGHIFNAPIVTISMNIANSISILVLKIYFIHRPVRYIEFFRL